MHPMQLARRRDEELTRPELTSTCIDRAPLRLIGPRPANHKIEPPTQICARPQRPARHASQTSRGTLVLGRSVVENGESRDAAER